MTAPTIDRTRGITFPKGFAAGAAAAGLKTNGNRDVTVVRCLGPQHDAAGLFTQNQLCAAPVLWSREVLKVGKLQAVVLNSGGANACTGPDGFADTHVTAEHAAVGLGCGAGEVAICSTGLIGQRLDLSKLLPGVDAALAIAGDGSEADLAAAQGIMTTDNVPKQAAVEQPSGWRLGGFAKGCGMIAPNMIAPALPHATMLSVISCDADVSGFAPGELSAVLQTVADATYNRLDVDGGTSTNDTLLLLCSGASGSSVSADDLATGLRVISDDLVAQLQADAEGVTKRVTVEVSGAAGDADAVEVARQISRDNLCKTAFFAGDPNWGRIAMAIGNAPVVVEPATVSIALNGVTLFADGAAQAPRGSCDLTGPELTVTVGLGDGPGVARMLTTDLSHAYVEENSAYSS